MGTPLNQWLTVRAAQAAQAVRCAPPARAHVPRHERFDVTTDKIALADRMVDLATHTIDQRTFAEWLKPKPREL
jgi:hypothetical protein